MLLAVVTTPLLVVCCWLELIANGSHLHQESIPVIRVPGPPSSTSTAISGTRNHLHNHSVGPFNASHRVTRRKSLSSNTATIAAVAQAMKEAAEARLLPGTAPMAVVAAAPGAPGPEKLQADGVGLGGYPSPPSSLPNHGPLNNATIVAADYGIQQLRTAGGATLLGGSAIADGHAPEVSRGSSRSRRASDGAGALGGVGKIGRMRSGSELKCEKCGKGYKHSSCLTKHLFVSPPPPSSVFSRRQELLLKHLGPVACEPWGRTESHDTSPIRTPPFTVQITITLPPSHVRATLVGNPPWAPQIPILARQASLHLHALPSLDEKSCARVLERLFGLPWDIACRWEHTPEWSYTSKLLISKHQQVQLLEAASILVSMNPTPPDSSSGASNNEGNSDSSSSDETTPPSSMSLSSPVPTPRGIRNGAGKPGKRYSSGSYSRSYSGTNGFLAGSAPPTGPSFPSHLPQRPLPRPRAGSSVSGVRGSVAPSPSLRPSTSEDDALAAAVELLSCSFNTPVMSPSLPIGSIPRGIGLGLSDIGSPPAGGRIYMGALNDVVEMKKEEDEDEEDNEDEDEDEDEDVRMEDSRMRGDGEGYGWSRRGRSEEEDDGVFGRMEE